MEDGRTLASLPKTVAYPMRIVGPNQLAVISQADLVPWTFPEDCAFESRFRVLKTEIKRRWPPEIPFGTQCEAAPG